MVVVAAQQVAYALAHNLDKVVEVTLGGTALCAPGCFTLLRCIALVRAANDDVEAPVAVECTVLFRYGTEPTTAIEVLAFYQGEVR